MPKARTNSAPSDLACFVMGLVWQYGPCSAYEIRRALLDSPSAQWSGSAGAIYPLLQRLGRQGLVKSAAVRGDKRGRRELTITPSGVEALKRWIGPPLAAEVVTVTADPLRSRGRFLGILTPKQRGAWIESAQRALDEVLAAVRRWDAQYGLASGVRADRYLGLLTRHAELETAARRGWLRELKDDPRDA